MRTKRKKEIESTHKEQEGQTKKREHTKNKRGNVQANQKEKGLRTRGTNLGVVEVQSRAHEKIWCAHKEGERAQRTRMGTLKN